MNLYAVVQDAITEATLAERARWQAALSRRMAEAETLRKAALTYSDYERGYWHGATHALADLEQDMRLQWGRLGEATIPETRER